jgi:hypothetical protein
MFLTAKMATMMDRMINIINFTGMVIFSVGAQTNKA